LLRLQIWLHFYAGATLILSFWLLRARRSAHAGSVRPIPSLGPERGGHRGWRRDALVVLPLIAEAGKSC
jgi:hypothetical protein